MKRILAFTNSRDATVDVVLKLAKGVDFIRFNSDEILPSKVSFENQKKSTLLRIDAIWYRRPFESTSKVRSVESFIQQQEWEEMVWNFFLLYPPKKWINYPAYNWYADRKVIQLTKAPKFNLQIPNWIISADQTKIANFIEQNGECLIKPISNGYIPYKDSLYHIYSTPIKELDLKYAKNCPTLVQKIVDKNFDVRTLYVDGNILFFKLKSNNLDVRIDNMKDVQYDLITPPKKVIESYRAFVQSFKLRFCTSDFVVDKKGNWFFLEHNANGNWAWLEEYFPSVVVNHFLNSIKA